LRVISPASAIEKQLTEERVLETEKRIFLNGRHGA
jgi:hypothetical protein